MANEAKLNLYQRIAAVMAEVSYIQKKVEIKGAGSYKAVGRDDVVAEVRPVLLKHGIVVNTSQIAAGTIELTGAKTSSGTPYTRFAAVYATTFVNIDTPSEHLTVHAEGHGVDTGDKGPGKAATYAEKQAIIKTLLLETGINEEGRNPGEGDEETGGGSSAPGKPAIRQPKAKDETPAEAVDNTPASKGLISMLKAEAEAKGLTAAVEKKLVKAGFSWANMPKSVAVKARAQVEAAKGVPHQREPGEEG